jgi:hypothetical protein
MKSQHKCNLQLREFLGLEIQQELQPLFFAGTFVYENQMFASFCPAQGSHSVVVFSFPLEVDLCACGYCAHLHMCL